MGRGVPTSLIDDNYFETFCGISCNNPDLDDDVKNHIMTVANNLFYSLPGNIHGGLYLGSIFKLDSRSLNFDVIENVFAIPEGNVPDDGRAVFRDLIKNDKLGPRTRDNLILWLGDGKFPHANPDPGSFEVVTGSDARELFAVHRQRKFATFPGHRFPDDPQLPKAA